MNFSEVKVEDPRWTEREKLVFFHLFRERQRYIDKGRKYDAHGVARSIYVMANVLAAFAALPTRRATDAPSPDPFKELL